MNLPEQAKNVKQPVSGAESVEILYSPMPRKNLGIYSVCSLAILSISLFLFQFSQFFLLASILTLLSLACLLILLALYLIPPGLSKIKLDANSMQFPPSFSPDMLYRNNRTWADIANILLGSMFVEGRKGVYEYEIEGTQNNRKIFIYFKSGGHATIDLTRLSKEDSQKLFMAIESWCLDFSRFPLPKSKDQEESASILLGSRDTEEAEQIQIQTYTELWEQEMQDHFSATNFVPLKKGDRVQEGKYKVLMPLSSGGLSAVYLVENNAKELRVLKEAVVPDNMKLKEKAREMFAREALLLKKINHPNIANVYDYFVDNGRDYLLLDFVPGNTLRQQLAQYGPIEEKEALEYTLDLIALVSYLHDLNPPIIHRDLSPDNLVLKEDGSIVLIDFGAANQLIGTATGTLVGKQAYMAPEQFRGKARKESDVYGIGATLFFLLTGGDPKPLTVSRPIEYNKRISPATSEVVSICTAQTPEERGESLQDLHEKIQQIIASDDTNDNTSGGIIHTGNSNNTGGTDDTEYTGNAGDTGDTGEIAE